MKKSTKKEHNRTSMRKCNCVTHEGPKSTIRTLRRAKLDSLDSTTMGVLWARATIARPKDTIEIINKFITKTPYQKLPTRSIKIHSQREDPYGVEFGRYKKKQMSPTQAPRGSYKKCIYIIMDPSSTKRMVQPSS